MWRGHSSIAQTGSQIWCPRPHNQMQALDAAPLAPVTKATFAKLKDLHPDNPTPLDHSRVDATLALRASGQ